MALAPWPVAGQPAERIVTLAPHLAEIVYAAGAGDRLVATVEYSDFPPPVATLPRVGDAFRIDLERVAAADPDLVLAWDGGTPPATIAEVRRLGVRVVALRAERLEDIAAQLRAVGALAGTVAEADAAAAAFEHALAALRARYGDRAPVRVFYQVSERPLYTFGGPHTVTDAIALCGGVNVFAALEVPAPAVSIEAVLAAAPQVIVGGVPDPLTPDPGALDGWLQWPGVPAVRDGHVYQLDATAMGRPTPRMLGGIERLCERIERGR